MAALAPIANDQTVYRGLSNSNWCRNGIVNYKAFMLRPATAQYPIEEELSLGLTPETAVDELREHHGTAALSVLVIHGLPHNLRVLPDPDNALKAEMHGLPLFSTDAVQRGLAVTVATDLAGISRYVAIGAAQ